MFVNTVGTDTCLNQVSKKTKKNLKKNKEYNIFEMFPEEITEKKFIKINWKKVQTRHKKFINSDFYKKCQIWWKHCKKNRLEIN